MGRTRLSRPALFHSSRLRRLSVRVGGSGKWTRLRTVRMRPIPTMTLDGLMATMRAWSKGLLTSHELTVRFPRSRQERRRLIGLQFLKTYRRSLEEQTTASPLQAIICYTLFQKESLTYRHDTSIITEGIKEQRLKSSFGYHRRGTAAQPMLKIRSLPGSCHLGFAH